MEFMEGEIRGREAKEIIKKLCGLILSVWVPLLFLSACLQFSFVGLLSYCICML
jgi:hypothetical protein